jgi:hypothetical protein
MLCRIGSGYHPCPSELADERRQMKSIFNFILEDSKISLFSGMGLAGLNQMPTVSGFVKQHQQCTPSLSLALAHATSFCSSRTFASTRRLQLHSHQSFLVILK